MAPVSVRADVLVRSAVNKVPATVFGTVAPIGGGEASAAVNWVTLIAVEIWSTVQIGAVGGSLSVEGERINLYDRVGSSQTLASPRAFMTTGLVLGVPPVESV